MISGTLSRRILGGIVILVGTGTTDLTSSFQDVKECSSAGDFQVAGFPEGAVRWLASPLVTFPGATLPELESPTDKREPSSLEATSACPTF